MDQLLLLLDFLSSSSSSSDDDDLDFRPIRNRRRLKRIKIDNSIERVVHNYSNKCFKENLRVSRCVASKLIVMFEESEFFPAYHCKNADSHVLAFLWYVANKSTLRSVAERFDMSISTLFLCNNRVMNFLLNIAPQVICFPTSDDEKDELAADFGRIAGISGVVGAVDGTYINVRTPAGRMRSTYTNRHDQTSITLQAICDSRRKFLDCFTGISSKVHDSRIFKLSFIYPLVHSLGDDYHVIGDAAYGIATNVMTPYRNYGQLTPLRQRYNRKFCATRVKIENSFGLLKSRFRHLIRSDLMTVEKSAKLILSCCVLHNICIENDDYLFGLNELDEIRNFDTALYPMLRNEQADRVLGERKRSRIARNL